MRDIGLIYVPFYDRGHLPRIIDSWKELDDSVKNRIKIYIIPADNPDGILEDIESSLLPMSGQEVPEILLMNDGKNRGFSGNHNRGIRQALEDGCEYIILQNGDLYFEKDAISKLLETVSSDEKIGSVQAMVEYWQEPGKINVAGGAFHIAGYGFAIGNTEKNKGQYKRSEIAYSSGASVLYRASALRRVGLLEEGFFMYHDDLELGLRLKIAGYKNILEPEALAFHDYKFSKNPKKFSWTELYRWVVVLSYYRLPTLILIAPIMLGVEIASWFFAVKNGWLKAKIYQYVNFFLPRTWQLIVKIRARQKQLRKISDRDLLKFVTGKLEGQEADNVIVEKIANPILDFWVKFLRFVVIW